MQPCFRFLTVLSLIGCGAGSATVPAPIGTTPAATALAATAIATSTATAVTPPQTVEVAAQNLETEERLRRHFAQYAGSSNFAFFEQDFAPRVERYLALKDVSAPELERFAKAFYAQKTQVSLVPKPGSVTVKNEGGRMTASFVLTMRWSVEPPTAAAACGYLDESMTWRPHSLISRRVDVTARIEFDAAARIVSYEEVPVAPLRLRIASRGDPLQAFPSLPTAPARFIEVGPASVLVPDGTVVEDLGETFTCGLNQAEVDTVRKVKFDGRTVWLLADWTYDTGHNFVGDTPLVPVR